MDEKPATYEDPQEPQRNGFQKAVYSIHEATSAAWKAHKRVIINVILVILAVAYITYVIYSLAFVEFGSEASVRLLWMSILLFVGVALHFLWKFFGDRISHAFEPCIDSIQPHGSIISW